jgi:hypothetical protein
MPHEADKALFESLNREHPDYQEWKSNWERYRDVLGEAEPKKEDYLPRGEFEDDKVYKIRLKLAEFIPESPIPVNKIVSAVYGQQPSRELKDNSLDDFAKNVDLKGTSWPEFVERVARKLVGYGTTRVLVNVRRTPEAIAFAEEQGRPLTVEEERSFGVRVFAINYSPLSVIDWETDDFGMPIMVMIREEKKVRPRDPTSAADHETRFKFIRYTNQTVESWVFIEGADGEIELIGEPVVDVHGLGMVPMVIENYPEEIKPLIASGFIRYISKADVRKIQAESDLHYDTYVHAHPIFFYKGQEELGTVGVGASTYLKINEGEDLGYVSMPPAVTESIKSVIDLNIDQMHRHAGTDPLGQQTTGQSVFQASGAARAWSFGTSEGRVLKDIANTMQRTEEKILDIALRLMQPVDSVQSPEEPIFGGVIKYSEEYYPTARAQVMEDTERSQSLVNSETYHKLMSKRVATLVAGEIPPDVLKKIIDEIERNPLKSEERMSMSGFELPMMEENEEEEGEEEGNSSGRRGRNNRGGGGRRQRNNTSAIP